MFTFDLTKEQIEKINEWIAQHNPNAYQGASGGRFTYSFTPTQLGLVTVIQDNLLNLQLDLTDYSGF